MFSFRLLPPTHLLLAVALATRREAHPLLLRDVPPMSENSWCHDRNGQISSAPSSSMEAIDKSTDAEKSEKDCSADYEARQNTETRKLLDIFLVGGEAKHVGGNPHLKWICEGEDDAYCFHAHLVGRWGKVFCGITSLVCPSARCSFKSLGFEKCGGKPGKGGSLSIWCLSFLQMQIHGMDQPECDVDSTSGENLNWRQTSLIKTVTTFVSWPFVSSQTVFLVLSVTGKFFLDAFADRDLTPQFNPLWRVEHKPEVCGKSTAPRILIHHHPSHQYGLHSHVTLSVLLIMDFDTFQCFLCKAYLIEVKGGVSSLPRSSWVPHCVRVTIPGKLRQFHFHNGRLKRPTKERLS